MNVEVVGKSCKNILAQAKKAYVKPVCESLDSQEFLQRVYAHSQQICREISESVKSKTLEELYTDEFRPSKIGSGKTTVKSLLTGKPVDAVVVGELSGGYSTKSSHELIYNMFSREGHLGYRRFGLHNPHKSDKNFETGYMESFDNNTVTGTQIRLLQTLIENVSRLGICKIPLQSLVPAVIYHTKMGFRPIENYTVKVNSAGDIFKSLKKYQKLFNRFNFDKSEITPIISCKDGKYYFDLNRTVYCSAMKHNKNWLNTTCQRNIDVEPRTCYGYIDMVLEGKEYDKWLERIKGFEITSNGEVPMMKEGLFHKIQRYVLAAVRS